MQFVRNVVDDLVEKRLWPVALLLVVLLVAVPVVLGSGGGGDAGDAPLPTAPVTDDGPLAGGTAITAEAATTRRQDRGGRVRDPFETKFAGKGETEVAAAAADAAADAAKAAAGAAGTTAAGDDTTKAAPADEDSGSTGRGSTGGSKGDDAPPKPSKPDPQETYRVSFRFGEVGEAKTRRDVARLTPFPSENRPYVIYLGLLSDKRTAVFLLSSDVTADGEGRCRPTKASCETVELNVGEAQVLDVDLGDGKTVQYELELTEIDAGQASTKAIAAKSHARASRAGRKIVQTARLIARVAKKVTHANAYAYDHDLGVLRREDPEEALGAHLPPAN